MYQTSDASKFFDAEVEVPEKMQLIMKEINALAIIVTKMTQYFLQKTFFSVLINCRLNKKRSKMGLNKNVHNSSICTLALAGVGM